MAVNVLQHVRSLHDILPFCTTGAWIAGHSAMRRQRRILSAALGIRFITWLLANGHADFTLHANLNWHVLGFTFAVALTLCCPSIWPGFIGRKPYIRR